MNIVMVCRLFAPHVGGVEKHVEMIANLADADGHNVTIITGQSQAYFPLKSRVLNGSGEVKVIRIPLLYEDKKITFLSKLWQRFHIYAWMCLHLKVFINADIIHVHDIFWWVYPIRLLLPYKKFFITFHGFEPSSINNSRVSEKAIRSHKLAQLLTRGNMSVGSWIQKWYTTKPTFVTYGAGEIKPRRDSTASEKIRALFIGRLEEDTGILEYAKAIQRYKNISLTVIGDGILRSKLESFKRVTILGTQTDLQKYYHSHDVVFSASYLCMIEALQSGTCVISLAVNPLKLDYIQAFPASKHILIAHDSKSLDAILSTWDHKTSLVSQKPAFAWARKQTWDQVYGLYRELWKL